MNIIAVVAIRKAVVASRQLQAFLRTNLSFVEPSDSFTQPCSSFLVAASFGFPGSCSSLHLIICRLPCSFNFLYSTNWHHPYCFINDAIDGDVVDITASPNNHHRHHRRLHRRYHHHLLHIDDYDARFLRYLNEHYTHPHFHHHHQKTNFGRHN